MTTKITTDWHISTKRGGGTTPVSQAALRQYLRDSLEAQLDDTDHLIAGDLFNEFTVDTSELMDTYRIFSSWLNTYGRRLALLRGNHDFHLSGAKVSSFDLLGEILRSQFPDLVTVADTVTKWKQFVLVPHLANQDILNIEIDRLGDVVGKVVVFHANLSNPFAAESQHSLNLTRDQVGDLVRRENLVVFGHEHQYRSYFEKRCLVLGNGAPSSIADCIGNAHKFAAFVTGTEYDLETIWSADGNYAEIDWRELDDADEGLKFIRVVGECTAEQSAEMVNAVATLRQKHGAFVISNAVKVDGLAAIEDGVADSLENLATFDVMDELAEVLTSEELDKVKALMGDGQ